MFKFLFINIYFVITSDINRDNDIIKKENLKAASIEYDKILSYIEKPEYIEMLKKSYEINEIIKSDLVNLKKLCCDEKFIIKNYLFLTLDFNNAAKFELMIKKTEKFIFLCEKYIDFLIESEILILSYDQNISFEIRTKKIFYENNKSCVYTNLPKDFFNLKFSFLKNLFQQRLENFREMSEEFKFFDEKNMKINQQNIEETNKKSIFNRYETIRRRNKNFIKVPYSCPIIFNDFSEICENLKNSENSLVKNIESSEYKKSYNKKIFSKNDAFKDQNNIFKCENFNRNEFPQENLNGVHNYENENTNKFKIFFNNESINIKKAKGIIENIIKKEKLSIFVERPIDSTFNLNEENSKNDVEEIEREIIESLITKILHIINLLRKNTRSFRLIDVKIESLHYNHLLNIIKKVE